MTSFRRLALVAPFLSLVVSFTITAQPLADRVPDDAMVYVAWRGADHPGDAYAQSRVKAFLDASALPQLVDDTLPKLLDKMVEKDRSAAPLREVLRKFGPAFWKYPWALYVGPVDGLAPGTIPSPRAALIVRAGDAAPELKKELNALLDQLLSGADFPVPVSAVEANGIVAVQLGNTTIDLAGGAAHNPLSKRKEFADAMAQLGDKDLDRDAFFAAYVDVEAITATVSRGVTAFGPPDAQRKWASVLSDVGLGGIKRGAWVAGLDGRDWSTRGFLAAPAPRAGLLKLLDTPALSDATLKLVPQSATMVMAGNVDFAKLLAVGRDMATKFVPGGSQAIDTGIAMAGMYLGFNIESDLLNALGDEWALYTAPTVGGNGPLGLVLVNRARDGAKLSAALTSLERVANVQINSQNRGGEPRPQFVHAKVGDADVHYLNIPFVTPAWTMADGNLFIALYPQTAAAAAAQAKQSTSILNNDDFVGVRRQLGGEKASQIGFFDLPRSAPEGYPYVLALSRVTGVIDMFGLQTAPAVLPPLDRLMPLLQPAGQVAWSDDAGVHSRSVAPFPGAEYLGGPEVILLEGGSSFVVPAIAGTKDYERHRAELSTPAQPSLEPKQ